MYNINYELAGLKLYGDDFDDDQIRDWFNDEAEGYANLTNNQNEKYIYSYTELNNKHGFKYLEKIRYKNSLGIGSAYGDEFHKIINQVENITILEPSDKFVNINKNILGVPCSFVKPNITGTLPFKNNTFDLILSFGVMHHIPNVSYVLNECNRCLDHDGVMLIREPIESMGDWRKKREGLTKRERGIPLPLFEKIIKDSNFIIVKKTLCGFSPLLKLANLFNIKIFNSKVLTSIDYFLCLIFSFNITYHRTSLLKKFAASSVFFVLKKNKC